MSVAITTLTKGVEGLFIENDRFNTTLISYNFYLPLKNETVAANALLPFMLTSCGREYPDFSALNLKLASLYGAALNASAEKYGDYQLLKMSVSVINDRFALGDDTPVKNASDLLLKLIFEPNTLDGKFLTEDLNREKLKAIQHIKGEIASKRVYAKKRLIEEMYCDEAYGLPKCGTAEDVEAITEKSLYDAWENMLKHGFVRIQVVGSEIPDGLFESISEKFKTYNREDITDCKFSSPTKSVETPKTVTDYMDVSQGKLCMGFSADLQGNDDVTLPLMVMTDIFGGGPYSKLFSNVREKMSLCYYCSASSVRQKGLVTVESGVETENCEKAEREILNQLECVKKGEFTDFEFTSSIKSITDSLNGYNDSQNSIDLWYALKINNDYLYSPEDIAVKLGNITREDVISAANGVKLNTVYKLLPKEAK